MTVPQVDSAVAKAKKERWAYGRRSCAECCGECAAAFATTGLFIAVLGAVVLGTLGGYSLAGTSVKSACPWC